MAAQRARRFALLAAESVTPETIDQIRDEVRSLAHSYPQRPLTEILGELIETQDTLFTLLERRQVPSQARQLHFLASIVSGILAKASHDMAEPHAAMLQARTAMQCASQADHNGLRVWLRGMQALVAYWAGRYLESIRYADLGREYSSGGAGTASVWLYASAARAYAALGDAERATVEIRRAEEDLERVQLDEVDEIGGICAFSEARTLYYVADALAWLPGRHGLAEEYARRAVAAYADPNDPAWAFGDQAGAHADLAIARVAARDLDGAAAALEPVLELPVSQRMNGVVHSVRRVYDSVVSAGLAIDARDVVEQIEDFMHTPLAALSR